MSYGSNYAAQNQNAYALSKAWDKVMEAKYKGVEDSMVGDELWAPYTYEGGGNYDQILLHTGLIGTALRTDDVVRQEYPSPTFHTASVMVRGYQRAGISYEYSVEDQEDYLPGLDLHVQKVGELPLLLADAEEEDAHYWMNMGESWTGGPFGTPLFVDGQGTNKIQLIGRPDYFSGSNASNIIEGSPSYALLELLNQYGALFVNEEGRRQRVSISMIVAGENNIRLLEALWNAAYNLESGNVNIPNPMTSRGLPTPKFVSTNRMANAEDIWVYYDGWEEFMRTVVDYRGKADSWVEGSAPQFKKVVTQIRSRYGYFFLNNRLCVLVKGAL